MDEIWSQFWSHSPTFAESRRRSSRTTETRAQVTILLEERSLTPPNNKVNGSIPAGGSGNETAPARGVVLVRFASGLGGSAEGSRTKRQDRQPFPRLGRIYRMFITRGCS
ncbi:hypothetical protein Cci01nite_47050 [Catellatospora citrea]|uniref:Uncharacterized protein n=1 Tax=Catellatospora citrea TaxID=53366 RepID=A0A8J3P155_9ACTN|nr:hypothetical protein Cci01nite_47050 [Catellatospora citrea]